MQVCSHDGPGDDGIDCLKSVAVWSESRSIYDCGIFETQLAKKNKLRIK